ncbi:MAG: dephospho-CoA kinase [Nitrospinae bacterium]|nr:dephospho-CoA kinase [Nitrospinota bacterium]MBF0633570.1 dephospho-CoA kinase [Nitrospinota bacterium]
MPLIGLTGGYASGKSLVSGFFAELGAVVLDADKLAVEVVEPGTEGLLSVAERFGHDVLKEDGSLDRKKLGAIVFNNPARLVELEEMIHPLIRALLFRRADKALERDPKTVVIADVALLFEKGLYSQMEKTIAVTCDPEQQVERAMRRDCVTEAEAKKRASLQWTMDKKAAMADYVVDNSGSPKKTKDRVGEIWSLISP